MPVRTPQLRTHILLILYIRLVYYKHSEQLLSFNFFGNLSPLISLYIKFLYFRQDAYRRLLSNPISR